MTRSEPPCPEVAKEPRRLLLDPPVSDWFKAASRPLPPLLPILSPVCGTGELYVHARPGSYVPAYARVLTFQSDPWDRDGRQPIVWRFDPGFPNWKDVLLVAAARDVEIVWVAAAAKPGTSVTRPKASMAVETPRFSLDRIPEVRICRVESRDRLPSRGAPFRMGEVAGAPLHYVGSSMADWPPPVDPAGDPDRALGSGVPMSLEGVLAAYHDYLVRSRRNRVVIRPAAPEPESPPTGVLIAHEDGDWSVRIDRLDPRAPGGFAYELIYPAPDPPAGSAHHFEVRILHTSCYQVRGTQIRYAIELSAASTVVVRTKEVSLHQLPAPGASIEAGAVGDPLKLDERPSPVMATLIELAMAAVGFVPVAGTLVDIAHLSYMQAYGRTLWGEAVTEEEILMEAGFALMGVVADPGDAKRLIDIGLDLFPGARAALVTLNPGAVPGYREAVELASHPVLLDTVRSMGPGGRDAVLGAMESRVRGGDALAATARVFDEHVFTPFRRALEDDLIPDSVYRDAWTSIDPHRLDGFDALPMGEQDELLELVVNGREPGQDAARVAARLVDDLAPALRTAFDEQFDAWRVSRVFNPFYDGFVSRELGALYAEYVRKKRRLGAVPASPVRWAANARRSVGRAHEELLRLLGGDYKKVIQRAAGEAYWVVSESVGNALKRGNLTAVPRRHEVLKTLNPAGEILNSEHVFEQRFHRNLIKKYLGGRHVLEPDQFQTVLVPTKPAVARQLERMNVFFYYVHEQKTELLRRLIPHGEEAAYSFQEIYEAHVLVLHHQLGMDRTFVQSLVFDEMRHALEVIGERIVDTSGLPRELLLLKNPRFLDALGRYP